MITWQITGLEELKAALRDLPAELTNEARGIVESQAELAAAEIRNAYPRRTGKLAGGVYVTHRYGEAGKFGAVAQVINRAPHAYIFELGTALRHIDLGATRGAMPPGHVFIPISMRHRARMMERLADMLRRFGLTVTYDAAA